MAEAYANVIGQRPLVLCYGELVVDRVAGLDRPGGAPLNFASALQPLLRTLGGDCLVVSRLGEDAGGGLLRDALLAHNLPPTLLQTTSDDSTGISLAQIQPKGEVVFQLEPGAWDEIAWSEPLREQAAACVGLLAGSLPLRSPASASTMLALFQTSNASIRMFDLNFRHEPEAELLTSVLEAATHVKGTVEEWIQLGTILCCQADQAHAIATELRTQFALDSCLVTNGAGGCVLLDGEGAMAGLPVAFPMDEDADPIGAGDHAAAGWMFALLNGRSRLDQVAAADILGAWAASQPASAPGIPPAVRDLLA
ncbi:MAG: PfkB family carbohydrate kinase [Planctomycetota bacterium]